MIKRGFMNATKDNHTYTDAFFEYINRGSLSSARVITKLLIPWLEPESVLDVGCGAGAWCKVWIGRGVAEVVGTDGAYVDVNHLLIPNNQFVARDLSEPFDLGSRFSLVTSLEVAEHIPGESADVFVDNLARHGDVVLFSAATPGQGGEFHVNEQPLAYWREKFGNHGYRCFDALRQAIAGEAGVEPWYRYNTLLYANADGVERLPKEVLAKELKIGDAIPDVSPFAWRARNAVIRFLPKRMSDQLVRAKHAWVRRRNQRAAMSA